MWFGTEQRRERLRAVASTRQQGCVVLEDIHDPHNAEAVFRTCDAFGIQRVCLVFDRQEPFNPRRVGKVSSSSANKWLSFEVYSSIDECLSGLKREGYAIYATALGGSSTSIYETRFTKAKTVLLLGNERDGLSDEAIMLADHLVKVPMRGMVQSLNLSVTAAICLYELTRQRMASGMEQYLITPSDADELHAEFLER